MTDELNLETWPYLQLISHSKRYALQKPFKRGRLLWRRPKDLVAVCDRKSGDDVFFTPCEYDI